MNYTADEIRDIVFEAKMVANHKAKEYINDKLKGEDNFPCGFAWVEIFGI